MEAPDADREGAINTFVTQRTLGRVLSLPQDFSAAFHRLLYSPAGTPVEIEITDKYFPAFLSPAFLSCRDLRAVRAVLALKPRAGQAVAGLTLAIRGTPFNAFNADPLLGSRSAADLAESSVLSGMRAAVCPAYGPPDVVRSRTSRRRPSRRGGFVSRSARRR